MITISTKMPRLTALGMASNRRLTCEAVGREIICNRWRQRYGFQIMKKLLPYFISYLIIAASTTGFIHFSSHTNTSLRYVLNTTLMPDELAAKLQQVGIPKSALDCDTRTPDPLNTLIYIFVECGVGFGVFLGLALLIEYLISKSRHDAKPA